MVEGGGGELDDDVVWPGGGMRDFDLLEWVVDLAGLAFDFGDCDCSWHRDGLMGVSVWCGGLDFAEEEYGWVVKEDGGAVLSSIA